MIDHHEFQGNRARHLLAEIPCRFKGGGVPKVNKAQERLQMQLMQAQLAQAKKKIEFPEIAVPPPPDPPPPPPGQQTSDSISAEQDARRRAQRRTNAGNNTLFAGNTGGYRPALGGQPTLLGGN